MLSLPSALKSAAQGGMPAMPTMSDGVTGPTRVSASVYRSISYSDHTSPGDRPSM